LSVDPASVATGEEGYDANYVIGFGNAPEGIKKRSAATGPGATALTLILRCPNSLARTRMCAV